MVFTSYKCSIEHTFGSPLVGPKLSVATDRQHLEVETMSGTTSGAVALTRRGRLVVFLTVLVAVFAAAVAVGPAVVATASAGDPIEVRTVTVQPGQTLWDIAVASASGDPRDTVHEIEQLNHLDGAEIQIGQSLDVPVAD